MVLVTSILKLDKGVLPVSFVAVITIPEVVPTLSLVGTPVKAPVRVLKIAQDGLFVIDQESILPLLESTVGTKL